MYKKIFVIALGIVLQIPFFLNAKTWHIEGESYYYYYANPENINEYDNTFNRQKLIRNVGNKALMCNSVLYKPKNVVSTFPFVSPHDLKYFVESSYKQESEREYLRKIANEIVGNANTVDVAVTRIGLWVRDHVTYALGSPTDAIGVIKSGRAYCVGYGEVMVELLRAAGIPARTLTCYIPPGCGWGYNNRGGGHAFCEFYYPGVGWLCVDPQSSLFFSDKYHIIDDNFTEEVNRIDRAYVVDFRPEPEKWGTYKALGDSKYTHPAFVFRVRSDNGNFINNADVVSFQKIDEICGSSNGYVGENEPNGLSCREYSNSRIVASTDSNSEYFSILFDNKNLFSQSFTDDVTVSFGSSLYRGLVNYHGADKYMFNIDFTNEDNFKKIYFRNSKNEYSVNQSVVLDFGGKIYYMFTDQYGKINLMGNINKGIVKVNEKSFPFDLTDKRVLLVADKPPFVGNNLPEVSDRQCRIIIKDECGERSANGIDQLMYTDGSFSWRKLNLDAGGVAVANNLENGREYNFIAGNRNHYIKRKIVYKSGLKELVLDFSKAKYQIIDAQEKDIGFIDSFYEYINGQPPLKLKAYDQRLYVDYPAGDYLFADNDKVVNLQLFSFTDTPARKIFKNNNVGFDEYCRSFKKYYGNDHIMFGSVGDYQGFNEGDVYIYNSITGRLSKSRIDRNGFFNYVINSDDTKLDIIVQQKGLLIKRSVVVPSTGSLDVKIVSDQKKCTMQIYKEAKNKDYAPTRNLLLLLAQNIKNDIKVDSIPLVAVKGILDIDASPGLLLVSEKKDLTQPVMINIDGINRNDYFMLLNSGPLNVSQRESLFRYLYTPEKRVMLVELKGLDGMPAVQKNFILTIDGKKNSYVTDRSGVAVVDNLSAGRYQFEYKDRGLYIREFVDYSSSGIYVHKINAEKMKQCRLKLVNHSNYFYLQKVIPKNDNLPEWACEEIVPDKNNNIIFCGSFNREIVRVGSKQLLTEINLMKKDAYVDGENISDNAYNIYLDQYNKIVPGSNIMIISLKNDTGKSAGEQLRLTGAKSYQGNVNRDGLLLLYNPVVGDYTVQSNGYGYWIDSNLSYKGGIAGKKIEAISCNLVVEFKGASSSRSVNIYSEGEITDKKISKYKSRMVCSSNSKGIIFLTLPEGVYVLDSKNNPLQKIVVTKKKKYITLKI